MQPPRSRKVPSLRLAAAAALAASLLSCSGGANAPPDPTGAPVANAAPNANAACAPMTLDATRYLRQLSLDLRGRPPSADELERVRREGRVPDEMIDAMLDSPEFLAQVREWHRALLWPTLDGFRITATDLIGWDANPTTGRRVGGIVSPDPEFVDNAARHPNGVVSFAGNGGGDRALRGANGTLGCDGALEYPPPAERGAQPTYQVTGTDGVRRTYPYYDPDGVPLPYHDAAHCPNFCSSRSDAERADPAYRPLATEFAAMNAPRAAGAPPQLELDPPNRQCPATHPHRVINPCDNRLYDQADRVFRERREGFRYVRHYWSGGRAVRTCAYEAQDRLNSVSNGLSCAGLALRDASCGCGPDGAYCMPAVSANSSLASRAQYRLREALNDEPLQIVSSVVERDEDYFEIFTTRRSYVTGATSYFYREQAGAAQNFEVPPPAARDAIPDVPYADTVWREYVRSREHAGVLTTAAYLGRFPTWRARVSQFRTAFMCRPFSPATGSLPAPDDPCTREPNLARRCGCQNCHAALEPMTAYFGRWAERSARFLGAAEFPSFDPNCQQCALRGVGCTTRCRQQYVVDTVDADGSRYAGTLRGYLYRTQEEVQRIDEGPAGLVASAAASGELQSCTARNAWGRLLNRPMSEDEGRTVLPGLVAGFESSRHNYRALVRAIVTSAAYRRVD